MAETLGTLTDKLSIVNLKLWHMEDAARDDSISLEQLGSVKKKIDILNMMRNDLIGEIDSWLHGVISGDTNFTPYQAMKNYGGNSNNAD